MKIKIIFGIIVLVLIVLGLSMIGSTKTKASRGKKKAVANKKTRKWFKRIRKEIIFINMFEVFVIYEY